MTGLEYDASQREGNIVPNSRGKFGSPGVGIGVQESLEICVCYLEL